MHALGPIIVFISSYRGRNLLKKFRGQDFEFLPRFGDMASQSLPIFWYFFAKNSRRPRVRDIRAKLDLCTELSWEMSSSSTFGHNLGVG